MPEAPNPMIFNDRQRLNTIYVVAGLIVCRCLPLHAEDAPSAPLFPSTLTLQLLGDNGGQRDLYLALDLSLPRDLRLQLEGGVLRGGANPDDTCSMRVGFGTDPAGDFSTTGYYFNRNQSGAFVIHGAGAELVVYHRDWMLSLIPEFRTITLYTTELVHRRRAVEKVELNSQGVEFGVAYFGLSDWGLSLYHRFDDYSEDLNRLARYPRLAELLFSQGALNLAWGLDSSRTRFTATRYLASSPVALGLSVSNSHSAVVGSDYLSATLNLDWEFDPHWALSTSLGSADGGGGYRNAYLSMALLYQW